MSPKFITYSHVWKQVSILHMNGLCNILYHKCKRCDLNINHYLNVNLPQYGCISNDELLIKTLLE